MTEETDIGIDPTTIIAHVRKPCTCLPTPLVQTSGYLAHEQTCPVLHAIPPTTAAWHIITRTGKSRTEGGEGVRWSCTCGDGDDDRPTCKHINDLFASNVKELDNHLAALDHGHNAFRGSVIVLTPFGGSILHAVWAANALRADPASAQAQGVASGGTGFGFVGPVPSGLNPPAQPIQIYRGPNPALPWPKPGQPSQVQPWVTPQRRRWWHSFWPFK